MIKVPGAWSGADFLTVLSQDQQQQPHLGRNEEPGL